MRRIGFQWTEWSTPPVTCTIVVGCWAVAFLALAGLAWILGLSDAASTAFALAQAFLAGGAALLAVGLLAGLILVRRASGRPRAVEGPAHR
jgi:hypothetical protein